MILRFLPLLILVLLLHSRCSALSFWQINANAFLGTNSYNEEFEWEVSSDLRKLSWPVSLAIGYSQTDDNWPYPFDGGIPFVLQRIKQELDLGLKKIWEPNTVFRCFADGGVAIVSLKESWTQFVERDTSIGYWIGVGSFLELLGVFNAGYEFRYSRAQFDLIHDKYENFHAGWIFGFHIEL